jgi:CBS domain containing-hemolysin-like protein
MTSTSGFSSLIAFFIFLAVGVVLNGIKTALGFYQKQSLDLTLATREERFQQWVEEAQALWIRPGFFESLSIGRFLSDAAALFVGTCALSGLFGLSWGPAFTTAGVLTYLFSHWGSALLAKAYAPFLGGAALQAYRIYSLLFMGKIGRWIYQLNESLLRRMGYESRLSFLGKEDNAHPDQEGENPDRSGLQEEEKEMIRSIFDLRETQAKEVMTPRADVVALELGAGYREVMDLITHEKFSRIPVYDGTMDHVKGILHVMSLMGLPEEAVQENFRLADYIREVYFVPRTKKIGELMREFRQRQVHMAIVVDEYGGVSGIVTLEDILEEIVGEIHDEDEIEMQRIVKEGEGVYRIDPVASLSEVKEEIGLDLHPEDEDVSIDTVGGFILYVHGRVPAQGDHVRFENYDFEILEMDANKIEGVRLTVLPHAA